MPLAIKANVANLARAVLGVSERQPCMMVAAPLGFVAEAERFAEKADQLARIRRHLHPKDLEVEAGEGVGHGGQHEPPLVAQLVVEEEEVALGGPVGHRLQQ